ncbi:hypothetical protein [Streptomyces sp. QHH-9511]|nr:hypothetical protein [Streptomyces sp. QHH-9511]
MPKRWTVERAHDEREDAQKLELAEHEIYASGIQRQVFDGGR